MRPVTLQKIRKLFQAFLDEYNSDAPHAFPSPETRETLRGAIDEYLRQTKHPEILLYGIASNFYYLMEEIEECLRILNHWKKSKGRPIEPLMIWRHWTR